MNYQQHLASALVAFGSGDQAQCLAEFDQALAAAGSVDPEGPRVAEVLQTMAQVYGQLGKQDEAQACLARSAAIWARMPQDGAV